MSETCRFCSRQPRVRGVGRLIKYGTRHYAHARCFLDARLSPLDRKYRERVEAVLDQLSLGALEEIPVLATFDDVPNTIGAIGMTPADFVAYVHKRRAAAGIEP